MKKQGKRKHNTATAVKPDNYPIISILMFTLGLLLAVAFIDYRPEQSPWNSAAADSVNLVGRVGVFATYCINYLFGFGRWILPILLLWNAFLLISKRAQLVRLWKIIAYGLTIVCFSGFMDMFVDYIFYVKPLMNTDYYLYGPGGKIGYTLFSKFLFTLLGPFGGIFILSCGLILGLVLSFSIAPTPATAIDNFNRKVLRLLSKSNLIMQLTGTKIKESFAEMMERKGVMETSDPLPPTPKKTAEPTETPAEPLKIIKSENEPKDDTPKPKPSLLEKGLKIIAGERIQKANVTLPTRRGNYIFPSHQLLNEAPEAATISEDEHKRTADLLIQTLAEFGVKVTPGEVHTGPVVTRYEVLPAPGVRVEKIESLDKNIALSLKAHSVRILAPVPGKGSVGIEIPNRKPAAVCLREILESTAWSESKAEIPIVLGKEVTGRPMVFDLTKMPHLLIAGSTGAGKTVCINTIIASLLYHASPEDIRFLMVDPKIVEMQQFNALPHMLIPVVTNPKKVPAALKWLIKEMEHRYQIFAATNVRNIAGFNAKILKNKEERDKAKEMDANLSPEERAAINNIEVPRDSDIEIPKEKLPYIVCVIDELADLMMIAASDVETCIARLAQLARAAGIHLIIATQRPSVNVITGVIKANLPSRIAFKVASKVDSRTIIDLGGADQLIGRGDMLFIPPGASQLIRAQGAFVSDEEIEKIIEAVKTNGPPQYADDVAREIEYGDDEASAVVAEKYDDDMVPAAIEILRSSKRASTSMFQRKLKIGYNRAARIMDILEQEGIVGPDNGQSPREILRDFDEY